MEIIEEIIISGTIATLILTRAIQKNIITKILAIVGFIILIFVFTSIDLNTYRDQLSSLTFYNYEIGYGLLQRIVVDLSANQKISLWIIQFIYLYLVVYLSSIMPNRVGNIIFFIPFIFLGQFNSLRQGFSIILLMIGFYSKNLKYIFYVIAPLFHITSIFGLAIIILSKLKLSYKFSLFITIGFIYLFYEYGNLMISLVNMDGYWRYEEFSGRKGPLIKFLFLFAISLIYTIYLVKKEGRLDILALSLYISTFGIIATPMVDALFRISYFQQSIIVCKYSIEPSNKYLKLIQYLIILNPSIISLLFSGNYLSLI